MLGGVEFEKCESGSLSFVIEEISEDLKQEVRNRLSEICYGAAKASRKSLLYSYQKTLSAFLERLDSKSSDTQKGMIGELITHVLFLRYEEEFRAASAYFNMEENSIKKGFDLVLHHKSTSQVWFVEVKAGECGESTSIEKLGSLLSLAKNDLKASLDSDRGTLWQNAINGANLVIQEGGLKAQIEALLEAHNLAAVDGNATSTDHNAILVAVCFSGEKAFATGQEFSQRHANQKAMNEFRELVSVAFQKDTFQSVVEFLRGEVIGG